MTERSEKTVGEYTAEIPYYEVPYFAYEVDCKTKRIETVISDVRKQANKSTDGVVYLNISQDPKHPMELKINKQILQTLERTLASQNRYFESITWDIPGDEIFEESDDLTTPPRWHKLFPTDL